LDKVNVQRLLPTAIHRLLLEGIAGKILAFTPLRPGMGSVWARAGKGGAAGVWPKSQPKSTQQLLERHRLACPSTAMTPSKNTSRPVLPLVFLVARLVLLVVLHRATLLRRRRSRNSTKTERNLRQKVLHVFSLPIKQSGKSKKIAQRLLPLLALTLMHRLAVRGRSNVSRFLRLRLLMLRPRPQSLTKSLLT
jgi:hypothetical protein